MIYSFETCLLDEIMVNIHNHNVISPDEWLKMNADDEEYHHYWTASKYLEADEFNKHHPLKQLILISELERIVNNIGENK